MRLLSSSQRTCHHRCSNDGHGRRFDDQLEGRNDCCFSEAAVAALGLRYVVITSEDLDDLRDGGAGHFARCIALVRERVPGIRVEMLAPDFCGRVKRALTGLALAWAWPDVFNHNIETVPSLYRAARAGADYGGSLDLLARVKRTNEAVVTKSGLMVGLGETDQELLETMRDLRAHQVDVLIIGQYLAPSWFHLPVRRYVTPETFAALRVEGLQIGFREVVAGLVCSSNHADQGGRAFLAVANKSGCTVHPVAYCCTAVNSAAGPSNAVRTAARPSAP
jgi:lipoic acid synthetase